MRYLVVVEKGPTSYGTYVPDLAGCIAVGETREEALASILEAIESHLEGLTEDGSPFRRRALPVKSLRLRPNPGFNTDAQVRGFAFVLAAPVNWFVRRQYQTRDGDDTSPSRELYHLA